MVLAAAARGLDVHDDVGLFRVEHPAHPDDIGAEARIAQLLQAQELVTPQLVTLCLHFYKAYALIVDEHEVRIAVAGTGIIATHAAQHVGERLLRRVVEQRKHSVVARLTPAEHAVGRSVVPGAGLQQLEFHSRLVVQCR